MYIKNTHIIINIMIIILILNKIKKKKNLTRKGNIDPVFSSHKIFQKKKNKKKNIL